MIKGLEAKIGEIEAKKTDVGNTLSKTTIDMQRGGNPHLGRAKSQLQEEIALWDKEIEKVRKQMDDLRFQMASNENNLLKVFREIMQADLHAPEHYFKGDVVVKKESKLPTQMRPKDYNVPMTTFWHPITMPDYELDAKSKQAEEWEQQINKDFKPPKDQDDSKETKFKSFLAPAMQD